MLRSSANKCAQILRYFIDIILVDHESYENYKVVGTDQSRAYFISIYPINMY